MEIELAGSDFSPAIENGDLAHRFGWHDVTNGIFLSERLVGAFARWPDDVGDRPVKIDGDRPVHAGRGIGCNAVFRIVADASGDVLVSDVEENPGIRLVKVERPVDGVNCHPRSEGQARRTARHAPLVGDVWHDALLSLS